MSLRPRAWKISETTQWWKMHLIRLFPTTSATAPWPSHLSLWLTLVTRGRSQLWKTSRLIKHPLSLRGNCYGLTKGPIRVRYTYSSQQCKAQLKLFNVYNQHVWNLRYTLWYHNFTSLILESVTNLGIGVLTLQVHHCTDVLEINITTSRVHHPQPIINLVSVRDKYIHTKL